VCLPKFGSEVWPNTTNYKELLGLGKQQIVRASKHLWPENLVVQTRRIGKKKGSKRHVLVDEKGIPISLLVSAANQHDSVALEPLLKAAVVSPAAKTECHLCLDAGYVGKEEVAQCNGFISHIRPRGEEKKEIATNPEFKARRWVVERTHSWFNRFRKLIPRYEKTDCSYLALTSLAAALITLNQVMAIYG
jgi:transposase